MSLRYSYGDYVVWEGKWELIEGIAYAMAPAPMIRHQQVSQRIAQILGEGLKGCMHCHALLPVDWKVDEHTVVQPDNMVVCYEPSGAYITKAPAIIFEVISRLTEYKDRQVKFKLYQNEGVNYYCMVYPDENLTKVYALQGGRYIKMLNTTVETVIFKLDKCQIEFNFSLLW